MKHCIICEAQDHFASACPELLKSKTLMGPGTLGGADTFAYKVHTMDNKTLLSSWGQMELATVRIYADTQLSKLVASWILGVYEREARERGLVRGKKTK